MSDKMYCQRRLCKECGAEFDMNNTTREDDGRCFTCWFWNEHVEWDQGENKDRCVVVNHQHWLMGSTEPGYFRGCGGARFNIQFYDGRQIVCRNLWHQGDIPENFQDRLPDNAVFTKAFLTE